MKHTKIVSAFPGTGKTHYCNADYVPEGFAIDSDSSKFDKSKFPGNYIAHIKANIGKAAIIFVSSHKDVRDALVKEQISFTLAYPAENLKQEYIERYKKRGSSQSFIELVDNNWSSWLEELRNQEGCAKLELKSGQYLSNVM